MSRRVDLGLKREACSLPLSHAKDLFELLFVTTSCPRTSQVWRNVWGTDERCLRAKQQLLIFALGNMAANKRGDDGREAITMVVKR